jgi:phytoene dehydrogenase-like protein
MAQKYDVIVVGGGPGGVSCAALLAKWGLKPLLLEKNERCGGKMITVSAKGFTYQLGPMGLAPLRGHGAQMALSELGLESEYKPLPIKSSAQSYRGRSGKWNTMVTQEGEPQDPNKMFDQLELDASERDTAMQVLAELATMPQEKVDTLDDISFNEFLAQYQLPGPFYTYLGYLSNILGIAPIDLLCAGEMIRLFQALATFQDTGGGLVAGGLGRLYEVMAQAVKANGGDVRTLARVEKITVRGGKVTGVVTKEGDEFRAPIVVSNAGIQPTVLKLVGEAHFDKSYVNYVNDLLPGWGFTGQRYFLSRPVVPHGMFTIFSDHGPWTHERFMKVKETGKTPEDVVVLAFVPSNLDPSLAPPGKQLLTIGTLCRPDPEARVAEIQAVWDKTEETMFKVWPDIKPAIEFKQYLGVAEVSKLARDHVLPGQGGDSEGLARAAGQCGTRKPSAKAPIRGLFYVGGDAAGGTRVGSHEAVYSGINVAHMVVRYQRMRQEVD